MKLPRGMKVTGMTPSVNGSALEIELSVTPEAELAITILAILDDNYKPPELQRQLIRESCAFVLEDR